MGKTRHYPKVDPEYYGDIDTYMSYDQEREEIERTLKSFQGIPFTPHTDDSSFYDGESYGYEG